MTDPAPSQPDQPQLGLVARAIGVITSPAATFADVVRVPRPAAILFIASAVIAVASTLPQMTERGRQAILQTQVETIERFMPVTETYEGQRFFTKRNGIRYMTPLFVVLLMVEFTDLIFAVDSIPAIFALTNEPLIVFTSNIFAILGLRALYFMLAGAIEKFHMLKYGLTVVLIFIGLKMVWLNDLFGGKFPISLSLAIITAIIAMSVVLSLVFPKSHAEPLPH